MRAVAIAFVVFSHSMWIFPELDNTPVKAIRNLGFLGVEIFFVLSGFLIGRILYRLYTAPSFSWNSFKHFLLRRWFRTLPNYYLILSINIPIWVYFGRQLPDNVLGYFVFIQNFGSGMSLFFTESWSLPIEEFAYVILPVSFFILFVLRRNANRRYAFFLVTISLLILFLATKLVYHFFLFDASGSIWNQDLKAVTVYRIDAIVYGVLAAYISVNFPDAWKKYRHNIAVIGFLLFGLVQFVQITEWLGEDFRLFYKNVLYLPLLSVALGCFLPFLSLLRTAHPVISRPITFLSLISYSVYLLHYSIVLQLMRYFFPIESLPLTTKAIYVMVYFVLTVICSFVLYRFYERPLMNLRDTPGIKRFFRVV